MIKPALGQERRVALVHPGREEYRMELEEEGQCEAWCWTHRDRGHAVIRRCTQDGAFDGLHAAVLCTLHANLTRVCLSEREATERRRVANGHNPSSVKAS